jgi:hypothetical protein
MSKSLSQRISIFLSVDSDSILKYFNPNDPAPLYYRQLSHEFQGYLDASVAHAKRRSTIRYKVFCNHSSDRQIFLEPLMKAIRRHYEKKKEVKEGEFRKFKKRNYILLFFSFAVVMLCQGVIPQIFNQEHRIHSVLSNAIDVFSWVILWKPIEKLIFYWNPFLKEILLFHKMATAEVIVVENETELINHHFEHHGAA